MRSRGIRARDHNPAPPLWVWVAVLGLLVVLLGLSVPLTHKLRLEHFNLSRLKTFNAAHGQTTIPKVVVFGTSLTRNAFYKDEAMERFATDRGKPIRFLRFTESYGHLVSFKEIAAPVLEAAPEVICFEAALFAVSQDGERSLSWRERITDHALLLFEFFRQCVFNTPFFANFLEVLEVSRRDDIHGNFNDPGLNLQGAHAPMDPAKIKAAAARFRVRDFSEGDLYRDFFEAAARRGVKIVFIDLSRSKEKWQALPPQIANDITALMQRYKTTYGITYIPFPFRLSSDYFTDEAHFGKKGRKFYSGWFVQQLPNILSKEN